jgi:DNA-binding NarL/FixJ family response regulator
MTSTVGEYEYSLAYDIINNKLMVCCEHSMLVKEFTSETMVEFLALQLSEGELARLEKEQKRIITVEDDKLSISQSRTLNEHFMECELKEARNDAIVNAYRDGYTQSVIAKYLNVSAGLVSMIKRLGSGHQSSINKFL